MPAVTADQMREIDRIAIEDTGPNPFQMMENAGRNLALHALDVLGTDWRDRHTLVSPAEMVAAASALPVISRITAPT